MANTITSTYFLTLFDEFKGVATAKIDAYVSIASTRVNPTVWGSNAEYATALLTAHMIAVTGSHLQGGSGGGVGGPITQESVGDLSRSYGSVGVAGSGDQELMTTRYGQEFVALRRETFTSATVTGPVTIPGSVDCG